MSAGRIRELVAKGDLRGAVEALNEWLDDGDLANEASMLAARLATLEKDVRRDVVSSDQAEAARNRIGFAILDLLDEAGSGTAEPESRFTGGSMEPVGARRPEAGGPEAVPASQGQKFFISFNSADRDIAEWIAWTLANAGHEVAMHTWEVPAGGNVPVWMSQKLAWADRLIAVVSPSYQPAAYSTMEWAASLWDDVDGTKGAVVPVLVKPTPDPPALLRALSRISLVDVDDEAEATRRLLEGVRYPSRPRAKPAFPIREPEDQERAPARRPRFRK